ncbi:hypothetical protein [Marinobacterium stanieri]|uniref:hypothetical protein n=1 Tax=Marinobacterium stanieri TaxID=49186 RepID=UPI003A8FD3D0
MAQIVRNFWTEDEIDYLEQSYHSGLSTKMISKNLERTERSVRGKACQMGLTHSGRNNLLYTAIEDQFIRKNAKSMTRYEIATVLGRTEGSVSQRGRRLNVIFANVDKQSRYDKNHGFFSTPSIENSYIAGLLAADGWIRPESSGKAINQVGISLKADDAHLLDFIRESIGYTGVIREYMADQYPQAELRISGVPEWINGLNIFWNLKPNKTFTLQPPNEEMLTDEQLLAYQVGLIDGDGHICIKNGTLKIEVVTASIDLCDWLIKSWRQISNASPSHYIHRDGNAHYVSFYGENARKLCSVLLKIDVHKLDRKWDIAKREIERFR